MNNRSVNYDYPLSFQKAKKHRQASRIFKGQLKSNSLACECCDKKIGEQEVQTNCSIQSHKFSFLGPGIPLFFLYLKYIVVLLLIMSVLFMGFAVFSNVTSNDCGTVSSCIPDVFNTLSLINKKSKTSYLQIQSYLALAFVMVCIIFFQYFRYQGRKLQQQCDEVIDSPSDYAIILRRLPLEVTTDDINELIKEKKSTLTTQQVQKTLNLQVNHIVLSYSLHQYLLTKEKNVQYFKQCVKQNKIEQFKPIQLPKPNKTSHIAIVVFQKQASKELFMYRSSICQKILQFFCTPCIPLSSLLIKGQKISIERAPQPDDIFWQNSGITMKGAIYRKIGSGVISIIILFIGGAVQYGLSVLSNSTTDSTSKTLLNLASSIIVTVFNFILMIALNVLTKKERNETLTQYQTVLMVKLTFFQFLNAGIFVVFSEILANFQTFTLTDGICSQISLIMIFNAILPNITLFILEYTEVINRIIRYCVQKEWLVYTQEQLNQIFIGPSIDIPTKYAYILKTLWLTALYAPLIPIVIGISMLGLLLFYFVEKILYTKSYSVPNTVSSMSYQSAIELLQYFLITFSLGELVIYYYFYNFQYDSIPLLWTITIFITISFSLLNSALPMETLNQYLFPLPNSDKSQVKYEEAQHSFEVTYEMTNPAYQCRRKRKNLKDFIGMGKKQESKMVAIELTNLFNDSINKNVSQIKSQRPLLSEFMENNNENVQNQDKKNIVSYKSNKRKQEQIVQGTKQTSKQNIQIDKNGLKKQVKKNQKQVKKNKQQVKQLNVNEGNENNQTKDSNTKNITNAQQTISAENNLQKSTQLVKKQNESSLTRKRNNSIFIKPSNNQRECIDPFGDLKDFTPPKFILKWRQQQQLFKKQQKIREKQQLRKAKMQQLHENMSKLTDQSLKARLLKDDSDTLQIQLALQNIYAELNNKNSITIKPQIKIEKQASQFIQTMPIKSKYHQSNGKLNIYEEYIDPSKKQPPKFIKKPRVENLKKQINKPAEENIDKPWLKNIESSKERYKFIVINQVPLNPHKKPKRRDSSTPPSQEDDITSIPLQMKEIKPTKKLKKDQLQRNKRAINEVFIDSFGKNTNSLSSISNKDHNEQVIKKFNENQMQFKDETKQKRATYNPIQLSQKYRTYFEKKGSQEDQDIFSGYLNKKLVMSYIGTPFLNLSKKAEFSLMDSPK